MSASDSSPFQRVADWLRAAQSAVIFTGAGMSTESGIPDFRSPGGVWARNKPVYYDEFLASADARYEYWRQKAEAASDFERAQPNAGHRLIAEWEAAGRVQAVITQNIDGLHQQAGSRRVLELHGSVRHVICVDCQTLHEPGPVIAEFRMRRALPLCTHCGGDRLKSTTVSFGQAMPLEVMEESVALAEASDLFLAIGSSLVVEPAASLPQLARRAGAKLVILNRDPTPQDETAHLVIRESIGQALAEIDRAMPL